ncbi:hypothetical protein ACHAXT_005856 [Thalassiosira profunda]
MAEGAYRHALPAERLGTGHPSLESFAEAVDGRRSQPTDPSASAPTEFSLVVVLAPPQDDNDCNGKSNIRILLGKKLRGFGTGFYNCFGGKLEQSRGEHDHPAWGAVRELQEETGIDVPLAAMEEGLVGNIHFTFEDADVNRAMRVHLYCICIAPSSKDDTKQQLQQFAQHTLVPVDPSEIRGCDEIEPRWFNIYDIPLSQMFADDSVWLTKLLAHYGSRGGKDPQMKFTFDAWFHFHPGGTETNSIMHHYMQIKDDSPKAPKHTLEKRLFHELLSNRVQSPSIKEFNENWAMVNAVKSFLKDKEAGDGRMEYVLDVAGGHGALAALFLVLVPSCRAAVVIDPAECKSGKRGVRTAWSSFWSNSTAQRKELRYRHECLRTGLRDELDRILKGTKRKSTSVTVVACHACQHLTDETLQIASEYGVNVAVLPCCQKDHDGWWKGLTRRLVSCSDSGNASLPIGTIMDLLAAGKMKGWQTGSTAGVRYQVKMKLMNEEISQQNRMILCKAVPRDKIDAEREVAHEKLTQAYRRAHSIPGANGKGSKFFAVDWHVPSLLVGACFGAAAAVIISRSKMH